MLDIGEYKTGLNISEIFLACFRSKLVWKMEKTGIEQNKFKNDEGRSENLTL